MSALQSPRVTLRWRISAFVFISVVLMLVAPLALAQHAPRQSELCPDEMPADWHVRCLQGSLLFSSKFGRDDELMPEIGNGHVATVVMSDTVYAAGVFSGDAQATNGKPSHRAKIPYVGAWPRGRHHGAERALDLERAVFLQRTVGSEGAPHVHVEERWYAPFHQPRLLVHELELWNPSGMHETVNIDTTEVHHSPDFRFAAIRRPSGNNVGEMLILQGSTNIREIPTAPTTRLSVASNVLPRSVGVGPARRVTLYSIMAVVSSLNSTDPTTDAINTLLPFMAKEYKKAELMLDDHIAVWRTRWDRGRVDIRGDLDLAQTVNASLYFLRSSLRDDWPHGISPGGLSSDCYSGHTFWDQETWMFPSFAVLEPSIAKAMLQYRDDRKEGARVKAISCGEQGQSFCPYGYAGRVANEALMFPWESAHTGADVQYWCKVMGQWGKYEQHISGDIALAVRQYWYLTRDTDWLGRVGFPLVNGTASFYAARIERRPDSRPGNSWFYRDVMGPDEYAWPVNNSAYTNAVVRLTLDFASEAAEELGHMGPVYADFKAKAYGLPVLQAPVVPERPDLSGGYHPEYEGYPATEKKMIVKQADVILLAFPLGIHGDEQEVLRNDLDFYEHVTDPHGPAMTWSMFAVGWLSVGDYSRSGGHFRRAYSNAQRPFKVWSEVPKGDGYPGCVNFLTGAGGFLQAVIFGATGMRITKDALQFRPPSPSATGTEALGVVVHGIHYLGSLLRFDVGELTVRYELLEDGPGPRLCLVAEGHPARMLEVGRPLGMRRAHASVRPCADNDVKVIDRRLDYENAFLKQRDVIWI